MFTVYGDIFSGNCYKVALLLHLLDKPFTWVPQSVLKGDTHKPEFLALNPNAKIPLLVLDSGQALPESNAILNYLAQGTEFLPDSPLARARVLQWQFFEQYSHEPTIAVARFIMRYLNSPAERLEELKAKQQGGLRALSVKEQQLGETAYMAGDTFTIADISLYAYTHVADEGGISLDDYPNILHWIDRIEGRSRHLTMQQAAQLLT